MAAPTAPVMHSVQISEEERMELVRILEGNLRESRVEAHRTHTPDYRERVLDEQALLRGLLEKLQHLRV